MAPRAALGGYRPGEQRREAAPEAEFSPRTKSESFEKAKKQMAAKDGKGDANERQLRDRAAAGKAAEEDGTRVYFDDKSAVQFTTTLMGS